MAETREMLPEEVVLAVLHKAGKEVRIVDDRRLAEIFDEAARDSELFAAFKSHKQYHYSRTLTNALQVLDLGGSIVRENAPAKYFKPSGHTTGPYGQKLFEALSETEQRAVEEVANKIRERFSVTPTLDRAS